MATYTYVLKNQHACEECARQMGRTKNNEEWNMVKPEIKKCTLCVQKNKTYQARYYKNINNTKAI